MKTITLTDEQAQFLTDAMNWWKTSGVNYWSQKSADEVLQELAKTENKFCVFCDNDYADLDSHNANTHELTNQAKPPRGGLGQGGPLPTEEPSQGRQEKRK